MKNKLSKLVLLVILVASSLQPTAAFAEDEFSQAGSLVDLENVIFQAIQDREPVFRVRYSGNTDNIKQDVKDARDHAVARDQYQETSISLISGFKISNFPTYADISFDAFQYFTTKQQEQFVEQEVTKILGQITTSSMNDHAKEKAIHDYILKRINYDYSLAGYTAYAALKSGVTVCNGYVQLGYKLLNQAGIETKMVKGTLERTGSTRKDHAWLLVKIEGNWYHVDPTLDDTLAGAGGDPLKYFNLSDTEISLDHNFNHADYPTAPLTYSQAVTNGSSGSGASGVIGYFEETTVANKVTASLDAAKFLAMLENSDANKVLYDLQLNSPGNSYEIAVPIQVIKILAEKSPKAVLRLSTSIGCYDLPAIGLVFSTEELVQQELPAQLVIKINQLEESIRTNAIKVSKQAGLQLVGTPLSFTVDFKGNVARQLPGASKFVARSINLNQKISADSGVGLRYNPESGELRPVPTVFSEVNGKSVARLNSLGNGIFMVAVNSKIKFADLTGHWATGNIEKLAQKMIVKGKDRDHFDPNGKVSRAEYAAMLVSALGLADFGDVSEQQATGFKDVTGAWFTKSVRIANAYGLINGYTDGSFRPSAAVSREEMAVMLARAMALADLKQFDKLENTGKFRDQGQIGTWAQDAVSLTNKASIIQGNQLGQFLPRVSASRAEAVAMIDRMLKHIGFIN